MHRHTHFAIKLGQIDDLIDTHMQEKLQVSLRAKMLKKKMADLQKILYLKQNAHRNDVIN